MKVIDAPAGNPNAIGGSTGGKSGGGFKKSGFKSSFASVKGPAAPVKKNVLGNDDDNEEEDYTATKDQARAASNPVPKEVRDDAESDTDEEYTRDRDGGGYYDPRRPTGCLAGCKDLGGIQAST